MEYHSTIWPSRHFDILIWKIFSSKIATEEWLIWLIYQILTWSNYHRHVEKYDIKSQHGGSYGVCYGRKKLRMYSGITRFTIINGAACASSSLTLQLFAALNKWLKCRKLKKMSKNNKQDSSKINSNWLKFQNLFNQ